MVIGIRDASHFATALIAVTILVMNTNIEAARAALRSRVSFSRVELAAMENMLAADTIAGWVGLSINDGLLRNIAEDSARLAKVSFAGAKSALLLASLSREGGLRLAVWNVTVAKDGDTWERQVGQVKARGSLKTLRAAVVKGGTAQFGNQADLVKLGKTLTVDRKTLREAGLQDVLKAAPEKAAPKKK